MIRQISKEEMYCKGGQERYKGEDRMIAYGENHLACVLLLDVSASMEGRAIDSLNQAIKRFKMQLMSDPVAVQRVDIALVTFSSEARLVSDFVPISEMPTPILQAEGYTEMAEGIQVAIDLVRERGQLYSRLGTPCYKPWIFMITDGLSTSSQEEMEQAGERIRLEESKGSHGHLAFWALGIDDYSSKELFALTRRVVELKDQDFSTIFDWLSESFVTISHSRIDENIAFNPLPDNARKAKEDRTIDEGWQ